MDKVTSSYIIDPHSDTWRAVAFWLEQRLQLHRSNLEMLGLPPDDTESARGAIGELKELKGLAEPRAAIFGSTTAEAEL